MRHIKISIGRNSEDHVLEMLRIRRRPSQEEVIAFITVLDEELRLPDCLNHHRKLGVDRFVVIDNGSTDNTVAFLLEQPDVDLWLTKNSFSGSNTGMFWFYALAANYGFDRWYLIIDADELLVYENMEEHDLGYVAERLTELGILSLRAPLIDMYSDKSIGNIGYKCGGSLIKTCPYFDGDSYRYRKSANGRTSLSGGPRVRLVSQKQEKFSHALEKHPFRFWPKKKIFRTIHEPPFPLQFYPPMGALLHFKFLDDFKFKVDEAVRKKNHWQDSIEYKRYAKRYKELSHPYYSGSKTYEGPHTLAKCGITAPFPW